MNLAGLFQYGNRNMKSSGAVTGKTQIAPSSGQTSHAVRNLSAGQTIQGEVVGKNGSEIQIRVDDAVITAKLDADMNVSVGQSLTFEVKNNAGGQIALRPLYENLTQDANVLKALEAAKLPVTDGLVRMVSAMMVRGMPIDKNALADMGKLIMANPGTSPETLVLMKNLQIPATPENITQFENYQRFEHQILSNMTDILMELPNAFASMASGGDGNAAVSFYMQILQLFTGAEALESNGAAMPPGNVFTDIVEESGMEGNGQPAGGGKVFLPGGSEEVPPGPDAGSLKGAYAQAEREMDKSLLQLAGEEGKQLQENTIGMQNKGLSYPMLLEEILDGGGRRQLAADLGRLGFLPEQQKMVQNGEIPVEQLLKDIQRFLTEKGDAVNQKDVLHLFAGKEYNLLLSKQIKQQWLMKPEDVANKNDVEAFYHRLRQQTGRLMEAAGQAGKDMPFTKNLTTMQNNIDFMNQMNQVFNYIQFPLKMSGGEAHGDLYVYTNRKNTRKEDGSVSALLHLDMEHLGPLDVYVVMKGTDVNTKFYLQDDKMIDFIAAHIHMLNERLEKRGYSFHAEMKVNEEEDENRDVIKKITAQESKTSLVAQYAFDVRA